MNDAQTIFDLIYALAASDGRDAALFGSSAQAARMAFAHSNPGTAFPELWFELPLAGDPWFDLHVLADRADLRNADPQTAFSPGSCGGHEDVFRWFAEQGDSARQLALSWDLNGADQGSAGAAIQLLLWNRDDAMACDFLQTAGKPEAVDAYQSFVERIPAGWFACYAGVFPMRPGHNLRIECIPAYAQQQAYAQNKVLLARDLQQAGIENPGDNMLERCQLLAQTPFQLEFQFDVEQEGILGTTFGASLRFAAPHHANDDSSFTTDGASGSLMSKLEAWGLADARWRLLADTIGAWRLGHADGRPPVTLFCYPAFVKLRWRNGEPLDAKAYLVAGIQS